jgi:hypothetical protein
VAARLIATTGLPCTTRSSVSGSFVTRTTLWAVIGLVAADARLVLIAISPLRRRVQANRQSAVRIRARPTETSRPSEWWG